MSLSIRGAGLKGINTALRGFATQSSAHSHDLHGQPLGKPSVKQTKLPNGLAIVALENYSPISRVGVFVRAGPRFEQPGQLGLTHVLRSATGLSTSRSTTFGITRNIDYLGGTLTANSTREDFIFVLEIQRDNLGSTIGFLADSVTQPAFKPWELSDNSYRIEIDRKRMKRSPEVRLMELTHEAAFKSGGLSNSLFCRKSLIGKHDHNALMEYFNTHFVTSRMAVVGVGVELSNLVDAVEKTFTFNSVPAPEISKSKFTAGNVRAEKGGNVAYVSVVAEGASAKNAKDVVALSLFQQLLGNGPRVKYSDAKASPLGGAAASATQHPFALTGINISYSDTGLFGVAVGGASSDIHNVVKAVVKKMRDVGSGLNDSQLKTAKQQLKAHALLSLEQQNQVLEELGTRALNGETSISLDNVESAIDSLSLNDVKEIVSRVLKGRVAIAGLGQVHNVPYIEDLI